MRYPTTSNIGSSLTAKCGLAAQVGYPAHRLPPQDSGLRSDHISECFEYQSTISMAVRDSLGAARCNPWCTKRQCSADGLECSWQAALESRAARDSRPYRRRFKRGSQRHAFAAPPARRPGRATARVDAHLGGRFSGRQPRLASTGASQSDRRSLTSLRSLNAAWRVSRFTS